MRVDKSGRQCFSRGVQLMVRGIMQRGGEVQDASVLNGNIQQFGGASSAIENTGIADESVAVGHRMRSRR